MDENLGQWRQNRRNDYAHQMKFKSKKNHGTKHSGTPRHCEKTNNSKGY